jgi:23S rRNA pseudouridine2605 synthase
MHPRSKVPKTYEVLVEGRVSAETIRRLRNGVELDDGPTLPARVDQMRRARPGHTWLLMELTEGRNRQIKRMGEAVGHPVRRLHRSRYAGLGLKGLRTGEWRPLSRDEVARVARVAGAPAAAGASA